MHKPIIQKIISSLLLVSLIALTTGFVFIPRKASAINLGKIAKVGLAAGAASMLLGGDEECGGTVAGKVGGTIIKLAMAAGKVVGFVAKNALKLGFKALGNIIPGGKIVGGVLKSIGKKIFGKIPGLGKLFGGGPERGSEQKPTYVVTKDEGKETKQLAFRECILKPYISVLMAIMIRSLTNSIVSWIQGYDAYGRSNVGFVGNLKSELKYEMNRRAGEFLNQLSGVNLCGNISRSFNINIGYPESLTSGFGLNRQLGCTVTDVVKNVKYQSEYFFQDFRYGGWQAFIAHSLVPENNPYGAYFIALDSKIAAEAAAQNQVERGYTAGGGFLGFQVREKGKCTPVSAEITGGLLQGTGGTNFSKYQSAQRRLQAMGAEKDASGRWVTCETTTVTKTPGQTAAYMLNKTMGIGLDQALVANEVDNLITSMIQATINRLLSSSSGSGKGIFDSKLPTAAEEGQTAEDASSDELTTKIDIPILLDMVKTNTSMDYLDTNVFVSTLSSVATNLSDAGYGQYVPQLPEGSEGSYAVDSQTIKEMQNFARTQSAQSLTISVANFDIYNSRLPQKLALKDLQIQFLDRLMDILESSDDEEEVRIELQKPSIELNLTGLEQTLDQNLADLSLFSLTGTVEDNLIRMLGGFQTIANNVSQKIDTLNSIDILGLPTVMNNPEKSGKIGILASQINAQKIDLDLTRTILDEKVTEMGLDQLSDFIIDNLPKLKKILEISYEIDSLLTQLLAAALDVSFIPPSTSTTATPAGGTAPQTTTPSSPLFQVPDEPQYEIPANEQ